MLQRKIRQSLRVPHLTFARSLIMSGAILKTIQTPYARSFSLSLLPIPFPTL
jgi:hypothetical protein